MRKLLPEFRIWIQSILKCSSTPHFSHSAYQSRPGAETFNSSARLARQLADEGKPDALFTIEAPTAAVMTAHTFLDKYGTVEQWLKGA